MYYSARAIIIVCYTYDGVNCANVNFVTAQYRVYANCRLTVVCASEIVSGHFV